MSKRPLRWANDLHLSSAKSVYLRHPSEDAFVPTSDYFRVLTVRCKWHNQPRGDEFVRLVLTNPGGSAIGNAQTRKFLCFSSVAGAYSCWALMCHFRASNSEHRITHTSSYVTRAKSFLNWPDSEELFMKATLPGDYYWASEQPFD